MNELEDGFAPVPDFVFKLNDQMLRSLVACLRLLLRAALVFIVAGLLMAMIPFQPWEAAWYLKIGQVSYEYGVTCLFAFALALFAEFFESDVERAFQRRTRLLSLATAGVAVFALLVPLQMFSYGQVWMNSRDQTRMSVGSLNANLTRLSEEIQSARNLPALYAAMETIKATPPRELEGLTLAE
ncbi:MAG: hypothetical protein ACKOZW_14565 [Cyanobium sp.]